MDFPFARSLVVVRSRRTEKRSGKSTEETRYYISSLEPEDPTPEQWLQLIRGHWADVENVLAPIKTPARPASRCSDGDRSRSQARRKKYFGLER